MVSYISLSNIQRAINSLANKRKGCVFYEFRSLYSQTFTYALQQVIGHLRIVPGVPLDRSLVPEDAPSVPAYLLVIVDDADINKDNLIDFEERASYALLKRFSTEAISFQHCQFYYPSPAFIFEQADALTNPVM